MGKGNKPDMTYHHNSTRRVRASTRILALAGVLAIAGCSGGSFREAVGIAKSPPDESKVRVVEPLSLPPDISLPAPDRSQPAREIGRPLPPAQPVQQQQVAGGYYDPANGAQAGGGGTQYPPQAQYPAPQGQPQYQQQAQYPAQQGNPAYQPQNNPAYPAPQPQRQEGDNDPRPVGQRLAAGNEPTDPYERIGISKYNPDGTEKTDAQLRKEAREKWLERKKAEEPGWGNASNVWGAVFGD